MTSRDCKCGSGKTSYELFDARGIYVARVCEHCEEKTKDKYRPEIFYDEDYFCDEPIDPEDY